MKPKKLYFVLLGLIGLLTALTFAMFIFGQQLLSKRITEIQTLSGDIQLQTEQIQSLQTQEKDFAEIAPLAEKAQSILPSQKDQAEVVAQISSIVAQSGLPLGGLAFESTQGLPSDKSQTIPGKVSGILIMPVNFETSGTYAQLQGLLQAIEKQERYMQVSTLDIKRSADSKVLVINVSLEVYLKP